MLELKDSNDSIVALLLGVFNSSLYYASSVEDYLSTNRKLGSEDMIIIHEVGIHKCYTYEVNNSVKISDSTGKFEASWKQSSLKYVNSIECYELLFQHGKVPNILGTRMTPKVPFPKELYNIAQKYMIGE